MAPCMGRLILSCDGFLALLGSGACLLCVYVLYVLVICVSPAWCVPMHSLPDTLAKQRNVVCMGTVTQRHCEPLSELRCAHICAFTIAHFPHVASDILPCDMLVVCVCVCVLHVLTREPRPPCMTTMQKAMQRFTQRDTLMCQHLG